MNEYEVYKSLLDCDEIPITTPGLLVSTIMNIGANNDFDNLLNTDDKYIK
ncbi:MAG TPA: hypothetical protein VF941_21735 [Clostridia bacterium]